MRLVVYNIRYATGTGWQFHVPVPFFGYLMPTQQRAKAIAEFLRGLDPDIVGLVEVDNGSYRSRKLNQAEAIAKELQFTHVYESKYGQSSLAQNLPILQQQGNAFITNQRIHATAFHYFSHGIKRLVIELEFKQFVIFLVHLSIRFRHRQHQLTHLHQLFADVTKPKIVAGDFNVFWGDRELDLFLSAANLRNANREGIPTFPSTNPRRQLDFILHSPGIAINHFEVPKVCLSDHAPLVCDFEAG